MKKSVPCKVHIRTVTPDHFLCTCNIPNLVSHIYIRVLHRAGTHICKAGAGTCIAMCAGAEQAQVELRAGQEQVVLGVGQAWDEKFFVQVNECSTQK